MIALSGRLCVEAAPGSTSDTLRKHKQKLKRLANLMPTLADLPPYSSSGLC